MPTVLVVIGAIVLYFATGLPLIRFAVRRGYVGYYEAFFVYVFWGVTLPALAVISVLFGTFDRYMEIEAEEK